MCTSSFKCNDNDNNLNDICNKFDPGNYPNLMFYDPMSVRCESYLKCMPGIVGYVPVRFYCYPGYIFSVLSPYACVPNGTYPCIKI